MDRFIMNSKGIPIQPLKHPKSDRTEYTVINLDKPTPLDLPPKITKDPKTRTVQKAKSQTRKRIRSIPQNKAKPPRRIETPPRPISPNSIDCLNPPTISPCGEPLPPLDIERKLAELKFLKDFS